MSTQENEFIIGESGFSDSTELEGSGGVLHTLALPSSILKPMLLTLSLTPEVDGCDASSLTISLQFIEGTAK